MGTKTAAMSEELAKKRRELRDLEPTLMQARTKHEQLVHELRQLEGKLGALEQRQTAGAQATHLAEAELKALAQEESLFGKSVETSRVRRLKLEAELGEIEARLHASKSDQRESERERRASGRYIPSQEAKNAWAKRNRHKKSANCKVGRQISRGLLQKQPCEICASTNVQAHHDDYARPLDVRWLCVKHHAEHHVKMRLLELGVAA